MNPDDVTFPPDRDREITDRLRLLRGLQPPPSTEELILEVVVEIRDRLRNSDSAYLRWRADIMGGRPHSIMGSSDA